MADALAAAPGGAGRARGDRGRRGTVWALRLVGNFTEWLGASGEAEAYWRRALERADSTRSRQADDVLGWMLFAAWWGPKPMGEVLRLCDEVVARAPSKRLEAHALITRGAARAVVGELEDGRRDIAAGRG